MDKQKLIEKKLKSFFERKANEINCDFNDLKLIIFKEKTIRYSLYNKENKFLKTCTIQEIINLDFVEKFVVSNDDVEKILIESINKISTEIEKTQLLLLPNNTYFVLKNWAVFKKINLNEIL